MSHIHFKLSSKEPCDLAHKALEFICQSLPLHTEASDHYHLRGGLWVCNCTVRPLHSHRWAPQSGTGFDVSHYLTGAIPSMSYNN